MYVSNHKKLRSGEYCRNKMILGISAAVKLDWSQYVGIEFPAQSR